MSTLHTPERPTAAPWWQRGVLYEIYVRSFADHDGDGVGDLAGIRGKLDYLEWLGIDGIWLTPFYPSPMADFGYDIADHQDVDPLFGTLDEFDRLVAEAHARGIRIIVDYVPNHTSDQHPWFRESRSNRANPKRHWYYWRDPRADGAPPNNWLSLFGGSAWEPDEHTGQSYLHTFLREQPDLNWRNPEVQAGMFEVARFWLRHGVDGFRIDVAGAVMKDADLRDNPPNPDARAGGVFGGDWASQLHVREWNQPDVDEVWRAFRAMVDEYDHGERVLIGEVSSDDLPRWVQYYGEELDAIHLPFGFHLLHHEWTDSPQPIVDRVEAALPAGAWPNWVLGNHDQHRIASKAGRWARCAMLLLLTLRGTPFVYYGDELGMPDVAISPDRARDPWERRVPGQGRDPGRSPMRWDDTAKGGFCPPTVQPWLPMVAAKSRIDVRTQRDDPASMLAFTRAVIQLRRRHVALALGSYAPVEGTSAGVYAYRRELNGERILVALNLTDARQRIAIPHSARILISTSMDRDDAVDGSIALRPAEGIVARLES